MGVQQRLLGPVGGLAELVLEAGLGVGVALGRGLRQRGHVTGLEELGVALGDSGQRGLRLRLRLAALAQGLDGVGDVLGRQAELGLQPGDLLLALGLRVVGDGGLQRGGLGGLGLGEEGFDVNGLALLVGAHGLFSFFGFAEVMPQRYCCLVAGLIG